MNGGRTADEGREGRGLVAGMKAAFRSRPRGASKSRSGQLPETNAPLPPPPSSTTAKNQRSPRSPFLGWRKLKSKENCKGKESMRCEEVRVAERAGQCSRSQALRLSHHAIWNYKQNSCVRQLTPSEGVHNRFDRPMESHSHPSEVTPDWQTTGAIGSKLTVQKSDNSDMCRYVRLQPACAGTPRVPDIRQSSGGGADGVTSSIDSNVGHQKQEGCLLGECGGEEGVTGREEGSARDVCENQSIDETQLDEDTPTDSRGHSKAPVTVGRNLWLRSALSYSLRVPECPRNEVVVLALGVDQYVEEVFGFLTQPGTSRVDVEDFHALCRVLGLAGEEQEEDEEEVKKCRCQDSAVTALDSLNASQVIDSATEAACPVHLGFKEFRERLCERFVSDVSNQGLLSFAARRQANSPLVASVVSVQRRYEVLEAISRSLAEVTARLKDEEIRLKEDKGSVCGKCQQMTHLDRNSNISPRSQDVEVSHLQRQVLLQQQELQCLREVIDDLRVALQSSDAENLALQVQSLRGGAWRPEVSLRDLSLTDEENTIDNLVRQLTELSPVPPSNIASHPQEAPGQEKETSPQDSKRQTSPYSSLNTAFTSGDSYLEAELQATYEALQEAREDQEATQADLQQTVGQLQEREADLRKAENSLQSSQSALERAHHENLSLVTEVAETRTSLQESRNKLTQALDDLQQAKELVLLKEKQLEETQDRLDLLRNSKARVVARVGAARGLVAGSLDQVRAGEHALATLAAHTAHTKLEASSRVDSGLYSEDSERDEDAQSPNRSSDRLSESEEDLWSLRGSEASPNQTPPAHPTHHSLTNGTSEQILTQNCCTLEPQESDQQSFSSDLTSPSAESAPTSASTSKEIIEGLERELEWLQQTLEEAEREWEEDAPLQPSDGAELRDEKRILEEEVTKKANIHPLEVQMRQLLEALVSVADMNLSRRTLGRLVLEAMEDASGVSVNQLSSRKGEEVPPLSLLTSLLWSSSPGASTKFNGVTNEKLLHRALHCLTHPPEARERLEVTMG